MLIGGDEFFMASEKDGMRQVKESGIDVGKALEEPLESLDVINLGDADREILVIIEVDSAKTEVFDVVGGGMKIV